MGQKTEVKLPTGIALNIGDKVSFDFKELDCDGISLRSNIIRDMIKSMYRTYKKGKKGTKRKLSPNIKKVVLNLISVLDVCEYGVVLGVEACGMHCTNYMTNNMCYVTGGYCGLDFYKYKIMVMGKIEMESGNEMRVNHVQYTIPNIFWGISKLNLVVSN